ncbi:hypothetical protein JRO89_XS04G0021700 [Xanthoceras sorbifolium]|uniref:ER membrane protein complex subunit 10 n=1 Tax=Xanthoceras sorbifolium TaxID=99658 RepID=A0ABQ8I4M5_9ROSI|nr:hypothetical protein JRO89_XS04G0021700 [Xanthoceras sorbifolium]
MSFSPTTRSSVSKADNRSSISLRKFSDPDSDSKIQFSLEHAFGDSDFVSAGTFSARLRTSNHGGQTLTKLRFSRDAFSDVEKEKFEKLLQSDDFYRIRVPSNALSPPGRDYIISSVKAVISCICLYRVCSIQKLSRTTISCFALQDEVLGIVISIRCLPREGLDEHFVIHMFVFNISLNISPFLLQEGVNILAINYGGFGACPYPRQLKLPAKWSFNSHTVLKNSEQAPRAPIFAEDILGGEIGEGELVKPPERSWWAKYWMYLIPLGLIVTNAVTQAMNMPEEQAAGQAGGGQAHQAAAAIQQRGSNTAVRRR